MILKLWFVCQSAHQCFLACRVDCDPGQAGWDWTPVWCCLLEPRGSLRLGLWETKKHRNSALASCMWWITMTSSSVSERIIFYYLLIYLLYTEKVIFACVESFSEVKMKAQKKEGQVSERLWNTPVSLSSRKKWAHIYISSSFSKHSDSHLKHWHIHENAGHTHTHTCMQTHIRTHLQYTYNTLRHGRMRVK